MKIYNYGHEALKKHWPWNALQYIATKCDHCGKTIMKSKAIKGLADSGDIGIRKVVDYCADDYWKLYVEK